MTAKRSGQLIYLRKATYEFEANGDFLTKLIFVSRKGVETKADYPWSSSRHNALSESGEWHPAKSNDLFPVKALSRSYRGKLVSMLRQAAERGEMNRVNRPGDIDDTLNALMQTVYSKACLNRPETVVNYLARYSRKTAISDTRILGIHQHQVALRYQDYRNQNRHKVINLEGIEFIRRFLLHILPQSFMRIRHYGLLANRCRKQKLALYHPSNSQFAEIRGLKKPESLYG